MGKAIYTRISDDRTGDEAGVLRQQKDCFAFAEARGWEPPPLFVDNDRSAYKRGPRPAYEEMYERVKAGAVDTIIVWHLDRLYRHPAELEQLIDLVEATGVYIATVTGGDYDLTTSDGRAMARVVVAFARKESEDKARRTKRKHLALAEAGIPVGGGRAFGYELDRVTVRPAEAELIREAAERILNGETLRAVCTDWTRRGIKAVKGGGWTPTSLKRVLVEPRWAGLRSLGRYGPVVAKGTWPAIIDEVTHRRLRAVLLDPARAQNVGFRNRTYLLTGWLYCGRCGTRMVSRAVQPKRPHSPSHRRSYVCSSGPNHHGCGGIRIIAEPLEQLVAHRLFARLDIERLADTASRRPADAESAALDQIRMAEADLDELARTYGARRVTMSEWMAARGPIEQRLADGRRLLGEVEQRRRANVWAGRGVDLAASWQAMTLDQQRAAVGPLVDRVRIYPAVRGRAQFDPTRVEISWRI